MYVESHYSYIIDGDFLKEENPKCYTKLAMSTAIMKSQDTGINTLFQGIREKGQADLKKGDKRAWP